MLKSDHDPRRRPFVRFRHLLDKRDWRGIEDLISGDRGYAKLVCRCENVTEAEITAVIRRGHTTVDVVKFSTRAGMGRCQGVFCLYRVMKILIREAGLTCVQITKKGRGSEIITGLLEKGAPRADR